MAEVGILEWNSRVELVYGEIIDLAPISPDHAATMNGLGAALVLACTPYAVAAIKHPVRLDKWNETVPDAAVLRRRNDNYRYDGHPGPSDLLLLIEVADHSLQYDHAVKLPLYARSGIVEYWIVNLRDRIIEGFRDPGPGGYGTTVKYGAGDSVALAAMPEIVVPLARAFE